MICLKRAQTTKSVIIQQYVDIQEIWRDFVLLFAVLLHLAVNMCVNYSF